MYYIAPMKKQDYNNHKKYYPLHHFVLLPALTCCMAVGLYYYFNDNDQALPWLLFAISSFLTLAVAVMLRQHYALGNQNRIVRLEFRLRYFELTQERSAGIEKQLSFGQIAALRFADDEAFLPLLNRAVSEQLTPDQIKKSISNWQADDMRV